MTIIAGKIALHLFCIQIVNKDNNIFSTGFELASSVYEGANSPYVENNKNWSEIIDYFCIEMPYFRLHPIFYSIISIFQISDLMLFP